VVHQNQREMYKGRVIHGTRKAGITNGRRTGTLRKKARTARMRGGTPAYIATGDGGGVKVCRPNSRRCANQHALWSAKGSFWHAPSGRNGARTLQVTTGGGKKAVRAVR